MICSIFIILHVLLLLANFEPVEGTMDSGTVDIEYTVDNVGMVFIGDCTGNVRSLFQKAHIQCAVSWVSDLISCREMLVSAVIQQCNPSYRKVAHAHGEDITVSDETKSDLCLTKPLAKALKNFIKHKPDAVEAPRRAPTIHE